MFSTKLLSKYGFFLIKNCLSYITNVYVRHNTLVATAVSSRVHSLCKFLKNNTNTQFLSLVDIVVVDYPFRRERFEVVYNLLSISRNSRIFIKCHLVVLGSLFSLTGIYSAAS
jgi:NADH dehydrogenase (ubiquinone) Fe-S protein 3